MKKNKHKLPEKYVLVKKPREYLTQGISHCGAYSVKGILSAFGLDDTNHPKEYHTNLFSRITGLTITKTYWPDIFKSRGVHASFSSAAELTDVEKLTLLRDVLHQGNPIMVSIGNGYLPGGTYNALLGKFMMHWITLWGYDDTRNIFYVYDSGLSPDAYDTSAPIGNTVRTYGELLRDWRGSLLGTVRGFSGYHYIRIEK